MSMHLDDGTLVALCDHALTEEQAVAVRAHLASCDACRARHETALAFTERISKLHVPTDDARANAIATRALDDAARAPRAASRTLLAFGASAAIMASLVVIVTANDDPVKAAFTPRGDVNASSEAELTLYTLRENERVRVDELAAFETGPLALLVDVTLLPKSKARAFAVYARDATGRVWWILPSWSDPDRPPSCVDVSALPLAFSSMVGVTLDVPTGSLEVGLVVSEGPCALPALDDALEHDRPLGGELHVAARHVLRVAPHSKTGHR